MLDKRFSFVVSDDAPRETALRGEAVEHTRDAPRWQRLRPLDDGTFLGEVVDEREAAERAAIRQRITHESILQRSVRRVGVSSGTRATATCFFFSRRRVTANPSSRQAQHLLVIQVAPSRRSSTCSCC